MTSTTTRPATTGATGGNLVTQHLLRTQLKGVGVLWLGFVGAIILAVAGLHLAAGIRVAEVMGSIWSGAAQIGYSSALVMGVFLTVLYLPAYVAHGQTRRQIAGGYAQFGIMFAVFLAALFTLGHAVEVLAYGLAGWSGLLPDPHAVASFGGAASTLARHGVLALVYLAVGALGGAAFYRRTILGLLCVPACLVMLAAAVWSARDSAGIIPLQEGAAPAPLGVVLVVGLAAALVAAALTWGIVRDLPLRPRPS